MRVLPTRERLVRAFKGRQTLVGSSFLTQAADSWQERRVGTSQPTCTFPKAGIDLSQPFGRQPNRPVANGEYARTTPRAINVRGFEPGTNRTRGGQRSGIRKYLPDQVAGEEFIIQHLNTIVTTGGTAVQPSQSGRVVSTVVVVEGEVYRLIPGATSFELATNATDPLASPPLAYSGLIRSAANSQKLWFADGENWCYYDPAINTVKTWTASAGTLPTDSEGNIPTLIANWRGSIWVAGLEKDPQNLFGSKVGDPTNWDNFPLSPSPATDAIAGNLPGSFGLIGDVITALIPFNDDTMVIGTDSEVHILRGDPRAGGQNDLITTAIGMAFGLPFCMDPTGLIYFFSNRCGVFTMDPRSSQQPQRASNGIEQELQAINTGENGVCMGWDDKFQGVYLFISPLAAPGPGSNYYFDARNRAWFKDRFANNKHNPLCCVTFDGNLPEDRVLLIGSWDGYVRAIDPTATDDDGVPIESEVVIGPLLTKNLDDVTLKALQAVLGQGSGEVTYSVHTGETAELALASQPWNPDEGGVGTFELGRNLSTQIRASDHAIYVKLTATAPWSLESIRCITTLNGKIRGRGR